MEQDLVNVSDHVAIFRRRWRLVVACVILGSLAGPAAYFLQDREYSSSTTLLLQSVAPSDQAPDIDAEEVATQAEIVHSDPVAERVREDVGLTTPVRSLLESVAVEPVEDKRVVVITARSSDPQQAAEIANSFARQYVDLRTERSASGEAALSNAYAQRISALETELRDVRQRLRTADGDRRVQLEALADSLVARQAALRAALIAAVQPTVAGGGEVLQLAEASSTPTQPRPVRAGAFGAVIGLILGILLAYMRDRTDVVVRDEQRLQSSLGATPVLGVIPSESRRQRDKVSTLGTPHSAVSEAYRGLSTNVRFLLAEHRRRGDVGPDVPTSGMLLITSAVAGEGKTSVATNLAVATARVGIDVILVDADLRNPGVIKRFGAHPAPGLSDILVEDHAPETQLPDVGVENLRVLAAGSSPLNPAELLAAPQSRLVWKELRGLADLIIVDSAPVLQVADTLELASQADDILLVTRHGFSRTRQIVEARDRIQQVGGRVSGVTLNDSGTGGGGYAYGTGGVH